MVQNGGLFENEQGNSMREMDSSVSKGGPEGSYKIEWQTIRENRVLVISFQGYFSGEDAQLAAPEMVKQIQSETDLVSMVWDCLEMTGYESAARNEWERSLLLLKEKIKRIHVVSNSLVIRVGAPGKSITPVKVSPSR